MNHLIDFLNSKRLPVREILMSPCQISEKIDGNALQTFFDRDQDKIVFGKRYDSNKKKSSNELSVFDLVLNDVYYNAYNHLMKFEDMLKRYSILNFEIFDNTDNHIIKYDKKFKNNIVLLSGFDFDRNEISPESLQALSDELNVSVRSLYYNGRLDATQVDMVINCKNNSNDLWECVCKICDVDPSRTDIEGFVFNYYEQKRVLKVQNPTFMKILLERLDEKPDIHTVLVGETVYEYVINRNKVISGDIMTKPYICVLVDMYKKCEEYDPVLIENFLKNARILENFQINILPLKELYDGDLSDIKYPNLFKFILLGFRSKRNKKPLWCSLGYQQHVLNNFIENFNQES